MMPSTLETFITELESRLDHIEGGALEPQYTAVAQALALAYIAESLQQIAWLAEKANRGDE